MTHTESRLGWWARMCSLFGWIAEMLSSGFISLDDEDDEQAEPMTRSDVFAIVVEAATEVLAEEDDVAEDDGDFDHDDPLADLQIAEQTQLAVLFATPFQRQTFLYRVAVDCELSQPGVLGVDDFPTFGALTNRLCELLNVQ